MSVVDELRSLDVNDVGRWPLIFRAAVIGIAFLVVLGMGIYFFIYEDKAPHLKRVQNEEQTLRLSFENKQKKAANYDAYKAQLAQMEQSFGTMLRNVQFTTVVYWSPRLTRTISGMCLPTALRWPPELKLTPGRRNT